MKIAVLEGQIEQLRRDHAKSTESPRVDRGVTAVYLLALAASISLWFIAIRAPLWLDETGTYWQISGGFAKIWSDRFISLCFPAYDYILWFSTKILGTSEIALRIPSVLAMLGAVYLLYLAARELFDRDTAMVAAIVFSLHPIIIFAAIDVRPYAFGALAVSAATLVLLRLRHNDSNWMAALFGFLAACIVYFHYLFAVILPASAVCFFVLKTGDRKIAWRQIGVASAAFALAFLPVIPGLQYLFHTSGAHVYEDAPKIGDLLWTFLPDRLLPVFAGVGFVAFLLAAATDRRQESRSNFDLRHATICASLAFIPVLILYGVSKWTSIRMFEGRHRLEAIPGIALCWAFVMSRFRRPAMRLLFCVALVAASGGLYFFSPRARLHGIDSWKYAIEVAEKNASVDNAPVLICSDYPEADYVHMPLASAKESDLFTPLSYYKLSVPVVPLPRTLNQEAMRVGSWFLQQATEKHERFLAIEFRKPDGHTPARILAWLASQASGAYDVRELGIYDNMEVLEFTPRLNTERPQ